MGIVGPQIYQPKFGPTYRVSYICSIALLATCVGAVSTSWFFVAKDDRKDEWVADEERQPSEWEFGKEQSAVTQS